MYGPAVSSEYVIPLHSRIVFHDCVGDVGTCRDDFDSVTDRLANDFLSLDKDVCVLWSVEAFVECSLATWRRLRRLVLMGRLVLSLSVCLCCLGFRR